MAQQSKITSRPLTKALGTASILSVAIAGANMANAIQTDFGLEYRADAFHIDGDAFGDAGSGNGLAHLLRLKADFKDENTGISIHTSTLLSGDIWTGDKRGDETVSYSNDTRESVTLDTGYVQIPLGGNLLRVGRQHSNWNNCFLACDDRRDAISLAIPTSLGMVSAAYQRRLDSANVFDDTAVADQSNLAFLTKVGDLNFGVLWVHFFKNTEQGAYPFQGANILSPYIGGAITDGVNFVTGLNYVWGNENYDEDSYFGDGTLGGLDHGDGWSGYARLHGDAGRLDWGVQYVGSIDGGLIDEGFDTYSSLLNNNPSSTQSPTSLASMGGFSGEEGFDEHLIIGKLGFHVTPKLKLTGAIGWYSADREQLDVDDTSMIYDVRADYQINEAVTAVASLGMMTENEAGPGDRFTGNGNSMYARPARDMSDDDLMAANVGIRVNF